MSSHQQKRVALAARRICSPSDRIWCVRTSTHSHRVSESHDSGEMGIGSRSDATLDANINASCSLCAGNGCVMIKFGATCTCTGTVCVSARGVRRSKLISKLKLEIDEDNEWVTGHTHGSISHCGDTPCAHDLFSLPELHGMICSRRDRGTRAHRHRGTEVI